jgi:hypothetical protein
VSAGVTHTLALTTDGQVWSWGYNGAGELGNGTTVSSNVPVRVNGLTGIKAVTAGQNFSAAVGQDGSLWTWGINDAGQLGNGRSGPGTWVSTPTRVPGISNVTAVAQMYHHTVALTADGSLFAWGQNLNGQLGNNTRTSSNVPVKVAGIANVVSIGVENFTSIASKADGTVWAWGAGAVVSGDSFADSTVPVQVAGLSNVASVAAGRGFALALRRDGTAAGWGANDSGQLGDGTTVNRPTPVDVKDLRGATALAAGLGQGLALLADGTVKAWGANKDGELGTAGAATVLTPTTVGGLTGIAAIAAGNEYQVAIAGTTTPPPIENPPLPTKPFKYVALGDSFSAGEGIEPFWEPNNKCHRSMNAYSRYVQQPGVRSSSIFDRIATTGGVQWGFQACSGAKTSDVLDNGRYGDPLPQLALNRKRDTGNKNDLPVDATTDLVTITVGGNDVNFAPIIGLCALSADCTTDRLAGTRLQNSINDSLNKLGPQLDKIYDTIHAQAPNARIIVAGYPQLFPSTPAEQNCGKLAQRDIGYRANKLTFGFSQKEQNFLRGQTSRLNQVVADHVNQAALRFKTKSGIGTITFVPVDAVFQFHEICGASGEWINAATLRAPTAGEIARGKLNPNDQSFHPNADGERLGYAAAINGALNGF